MIFHIMKDGSRRDSVEGYIVTYEQKKELYKRLLKKGKINNGNKHTSSDIRKK